MLACKRRVDIPRDHEQADRYADQYADSQEDKVNVFLVVVAHRPDNSVILCSAAGVRLQARTRPARAASIRIITRRLKQAQEGAQRSCPGRSGDEKSSIPASLRKPGEIIDNRPGVIRDGRSGHARPAG